MPKLQTWLSLMGLPLIFSGYCWAAAPTINQATEALRAQSSCELTDPATLLVLPLLNDLAEIQRLALYRPAKEWLEEAKDGVDAAYLLTRAIRKSGKFDLADIYRANCKHMDTAEARAAWGRLNIGEIFVAADYAWVSVLAEKEYFGAGLVFQKYDDTWRLVGKDYAYLGMSERTQGVISEMLSLWDPYPAMPITAQQCPMPEAPQKTRAALDRSAEQSNGRDDEEYDPKNAIGAAQRAAVRFYGEGKATAASPVAQLLMAEFLLRSLNFENAPKPDSAAWTARVRRAEGFIEQAQANGALLDRIAPLLGWLGMLHAQGIGALPQDSVRARRYFDLAATWGDPDSLDYLNEFSESIVASDEGSEMPRMPRPNREVTKNLPKVSRACPN